MTTPDERFFTLFDRGKIRDEVILASFRQALRAALNPETGQPFTEEEIRLATAEGSRFFAFADGIDIFGQGVQSRDLFLAQQLRPDLANTNYLRNFHAFFWGLTPLPASGGSGPVTAKATVGTIFVGSTTIGAPGVHTARDPKGNVFQVAVTTPTPVSGVAALTLLGVTKGADTNPEAGALLTWINPPLGADPGGDAGTFTVTEDFSGGINAESDSDLAIRLLDRIRFRPASGNNAQMRAWLQTASTAVESGYVYACALHAGSVIVCVTQKRGAVKGPLARIPSVGTMTAVTGFIVPPASPVVPARWYVLPVSPTSQPSDLSIDLGLRVGSRGGWADFSPWPKSSVGFPSAIVTTVTTQTLFKVDTDAGSMPNGATSLTGSNAPQIMVWNKDDSEFEKLDVASIVDLGGDQFQITLNNPPSFTLAVGAAVSPFSELNAVISDSVQQYFDDLGPGEVIDLANDSRSDRAFRYPEPAAEKKQLVGQSVDTYLLDALGSALSDVSLRNASSTTPAVPASPSDGPAMMTLGQLGVYNLV